MLSIVDIDDQKIFNLDMTPPRDDDYEWVMVTVAFDLD